MVTYIQCKKGLLKLTSEAYLETEAATRSVLLKTVFLGILQNSQKDTCVRVSF